MTSASDSKLYRLFQIVACLVGLGVIVAGLVLADRQLVGYGAVILVHGLVATFMIWLDARRSGKNSGAR